MSYQFIVDNASSITIDNRAQVGLTTTRSGITRAVRRGAQPWVFTVEFPTGPRWTDYRRDIGAMADLDRDTEFSISFNNSGHSWMFAYQGNSVTSMTANFTQGQSQFTLASGSAASGYNFRAGDFVQFGGSGPVYQVVEDASYTQTTIQIHRPIIEASRTGAIILKGADCQFNLTCAELPTPVIFARDQVGFTGPFVFVEHLD